MLKTNLPFSTAQRAVLTFSRIKKHPDEEYTLAAIDVFVWMYKDLVHKYSLDEFYLDLPIPIVHVIEYCKERVNLLWKFNIQPVVVSNGQHNLTKSNTTSTQYLSHPETLEELDCAYHNPTTLLSTIMKLWKAENLFPKTYLRLPFCMLKNHIICVSSPLEANYKNIFLLNQGLILYALSKNPDLPYQGSNATILKLQTNRKCNLITSPIFLSELHHFFQSPRLIHGFNLTSLSCMLRNNYVECLDGNGPVTCFNKMKQRVRQQSQQQQIYFLNKLTNSRIDKKEFIYSLNIWQLGLLFYVEPNNIPIVQTTLELVNNYPEKYSVTLRSMHHNLLSINNIFWVHSEAIGYPHVTNLKIGFVPAQHIGHIELFNDIFAMNKWSQTGNSPK